MSIGFPSVSDSGRHPSTDDKSGGCGSARAHLSRCRPCATFGVSIPVVPADSLAIVTMVQAQGVPTKAFIERAVRRRATNGSTKALARAVTAARMSICGGVVISPLRRIAARTPIRAAGGTMPFLCNTSAHARTTASTSASRHSGDRGRSSPVGRARRQIGTTASHLALSRAFATDGRDATASIPVFEAKPFRRFAASHTTFCRPL